jgi:hypothetical protein
MSRIRVRRTKKEDSVVKHEVEPIKRNRILAIVLRENKSMLWRWVPYNIDMFRIGKNTYFKEPSGVYLSRNKVLCSIYVEGVSVPINHSQLERGIEKKTYIDHESGAEITIDVPVISNLKFDSEITDILLNRHIADEFTKVRVDAKGLLTVILMIFMIVLNFIVIGLLIK